MKKVLLANWNQGMREGWTMYWSPFVALFKAAKNVLQSK